jgi:hypothetical protein
MFGEAEEGLFSALSPPPGSMANVIITADVDVEMRPGDRGD